MLGLEELREEVESGAIDTVVCAFTDMQGRLFGKREHASFFLSDSVDHGLEGCNYLLGLDMEMDPSRGMRWRAGSAATATSTSCPTSPRSGASPGSRAPR